MDDTDTPAAAAPKPASKKKAGASEPATEKQLSKLTVTELRKRLTEYEADVFGKKADLVSRLCGLMNSE